MVEPVSTEKKMHEHKGTKVIVEKVNYASDGCGAENIHLYARRV